ncbi:hypothetical protein [Croceicoccus naphthovorans]|nr:hypothetical protein [Croceicoccus naphthovorans]MBB3991347.1 hypothetical protein [Croceicoccus naphthovorans]
MKGRLLALVGAGALAGVFVVGRAVRRRIVARRIAQAALKRIQSGVRV